nr:MULTISPECIES: hypothetical protein [Synechocystis]
MPISPELIKTISRSGIMKEFVAYQEILQEGEKIGLAKEKMEDELEDRFEEKLETIPLPKKIRSGDRRNCQKISKN